MKRLFSTYQLIDTIEFTFTLTIMCQHAKGYLRQQMDTLKGRFIFIEKSLRKFMIFGLTLPLVD